MLSAAQAILQQEQASSTFRPIGSQNDRHIGVGLLSTGDPRRRVS